MIAVLLIAGAVWLLGSLCLLWIVSGSGMLASEPAGWALIIALWPIVFALALAWDVGEMLWLKVRGRVR